MRLKTYFTPSVESAIATARLELGPDALLVHSRKRSTPDASSDTGVNAPPGDYEVVFAIGTEPLNEAGAPALAQPVKTQIAQSREISPSSSLLQNTAASEGIDQISREVSQMRLRIEQVAAVMQRSELAQRRRSLASRTSPILYGDLRDTDFTEQFVLDILGSLGNEDSTRAGAIREIAKRIRVSPIAGRPGFARRIVLLAGTAGTGKTTVAAKLAARFGVALHKPVHLISLDSGRVGGSDLLATYAALLGTGFSQVETPQGLISTLDHLRHHDLILIDTPGYSPSDALEVAELGRLIAHRPEIDTHLVVAGTSRLASLRRQFDLFSVLQPSKVVLTRLDEAAGLGQTVEAILESGIPISFLSTGQNIPEDLEPADAHHLAGLAFSGATSFEAGGGRLENPAVHTDPNTVRKAAA